MLVRPLGSFLQRPGIRARFLQGGLQQEVWELHVLSAGDFRERQKS